MPDQQHSEAPPARPRRDVAERTALWWPSDLERQEPEPEAVTFCRRAVAATAAVRSAKEAGQLLATIYRFARWLESKGCALEMAQLSTARIAEYRSAELADRPKGSQDAICSRLRKVAEASRAALPIAPQPVDDDVAQVLDSFRPRFVSRERFERIEPLVRDAARRCAPSTTLRAKTYLRDGSYLACWADELDLPLRRDVVFHPDVIEQFVTELLSARAHASVATNASTVRTMSAILLPDLVTIRRTMLSRSARAVPYSDDELASIRSDIGRLRPKKARDLETLVLVGLGIGPLPGEADRLRPEDVSRRGSAIVATLTGPDGQTREVTVMRPFGQGLLERATTLAASDEPWLLGGSPRRNRVSELTEPSRDTWAVPLEMRRLRANYLVELAKQAHPLSVHLAQAGVTRLSAFDELSVYFAPELIDTTADDATGAR